MPAHSAELKIGRTFGVVFEHGDSLFPTLAEFCKEHGVNYGYIPFFVGAFEHAKICGACRHTSGEDPMWDDYVDVDYVEAFGAGTIAWNPDTDEISPHIHLSVGRRLQSATGLTSHLFDATVQFTLELVVVEVESPTWTRPNFPDLYNLNLLRFGV